MVPASLVGYIETLSSGTLNLIKELNQDQLKELHGAGLHQDLTSLSTGVIVLKKNVGNNIQGSLIDLRIAVNDIEEDLNKNAFGVAYLKNFVNNLNITDLQRQIYHSVSYRENI